MASHSGLLTVMERAARKAGGKLRRDFGEVEHLQVSRKGPADFVSKADQQAERTLVEELQRARPDWGFLLEEGCVIEGDPTKPRWIIDPLDGTTNFLHGIPHYAVSIALVAHAGTVISGTETLTEDTPVVAVVYDPSREELFNSVYGVGAWLNGRRISCSRTPTLSESVVATGFPFRDFSFSDQYMPMLHDAINTTRGVRRAGAASLDLAWTACGRYDAYWEMALASWDVAAGTLLVREAGGVARDMYGRDSWPIGGYVIAGNRDTTTELQAMIDPHLKRPA